MTASTLQLVVCGGLGLASALAWRRAWTGHDDEKMDRALRIVWPYGEPSRRGFSRALPLSYAMMMLVGILAVLHAPAVVEHAPAVSIAVEYVGGVLLLGSGVLLYTVMSFNQPKFIVAPHRRAEPGVFEERRAAWLERQQHARPRPTAGGGRSDAEARRGPEAPPHGEPGAHP